MLELFQKGGPLMYPLLAASLYSIVLILERSLTYFFAFSRQGKKRQLENALSGAGLRESEEIALGMKCVLGNFVTEVFALAREAGDGADVEMRINHLGLKELDKLHRRLHVLELIGRISPMVGLTGTIIGLVGTFRVIADVKGFADPSLLAGGIWEALITTVSGLLVAIPALTFHHFLENWSVLLGVELRRFAELSLALVKSNKK